MRAQLAASYWGLSIGFYSPDFVGPFPKKELQLFVPDGASLNANIAEAKSHKNDLQWFKEQVQNHGPWDYKQLGLIFEDFGNFNYGATGRALGVPRNTLVREAGRAQIAAGTSHPSWGTPGARLGEFFTGGTGFYGDDPVDQFWIIRGIQYVP
jgi:hypothetical protein